jgi:hypothetical protein
VFHASFSPGPLRPASAQPLRAREATQALRYLAAADAGALTTVPTPPAMNLSP